MMGLWDDYIFEKEPHYWETGVWIKPRKVFIAVPTEEMRDVNWPDEVSNWYGENGLLMWKESVTCVCYVSMDKYRASDFDLVILDECHHLTRKSSEFFDSPLVDVMGLSATYPDKQRDPEKWFLLNATCPLIFTYTLDQGVADEIVAPFDIHVIFHPLDNVHKNIEAGSIRKRYMTTEANQYNVLSNVIKTMLARGEQKGADFMILRRRTFLCNLPSKLKLARKLIHWATGGEVDEPWATYTPPRTLVFCGSIKQADELFGENVYHSKKKGTKKKASALDRFRAKEISTLGVVSAVDEGINIPDLDQAIIVQMDSNPRTLTQRIGRAVRWREGHRATIWILVTKDTQDEAWYNKAIRDFDESNITYHLSTEFQ